MPVGGVGLGVLSVSQPGQEGGLGEVAEELVVAGERDRPSGQVGIVEEQGTDGRAAAGVQAAERDDEPLGWAACCLTDGVAVLAAVDQAGAAVAALEPVRPRRSCSAC